jgi:hypothetical protein
VELEITPEPSDEERAAIAAALAQESHEGDEREMQAPQEFLTNRQDSVRP